MPAVRLKPGVTHAQANAALEAARFANSLRRRRRISRKTSKPSCGRAQRRFRQAARRNALPAVWFGCVAAADRLRQCLHSASCPGNGRQHEFAVRSAIGPASRGLSANSHGVLLLSLTGAGLGLLLAYKTIAVIVANLPEFSFPHEAAIQINVPVLIFSIACRGDCTGILFGLWPAWQLSRPEVSQIMQSNTRKTTGDVKRAQNALNPHRRPDRAHPAHDGRRGRGD